MDAQQAVPSGEYVFSAIEKVSFGPGSVARLAAEVDRLNGKRVLLITSTSITKTPLPQKVHDLLDGKVVETFHGIHQHTPSGDVVSLMDAVKASHADLLVSLGGGSVIDATKAAVLALARDTGSFLPHISLPTTLSASEFSAIFGVTDEETKVKSGGSSFFVQPQYVVLDAELTLHTPDWLWLASGIRALDHAVETIYAPNHQPATDAEALEAIKILCQYLPASTGDQPDIAARQFCQIAAWLSFFGVANITLGLSHALGREIGPRYNIPHGYTSAVLLPKVMAYLLPGTSARQALIAHSLGADPAGKAEVEVALEAPERVYSFVGSLGLPQRLRDLDIPRDDLDSLAAGREDVRQILEEAW